MTLPFFHFQVIAIDKLDVFFSSFTRRRFLFFFFVFFVTEIVLDSLHSFFELDQAFSQGMHHPGKPLTEQQQDNAGNDHEFIRSSQPKKRKARWQGLVENV